LQLNSNNTNGEKSDKNITSDNDGFKTIVENFFKQMTELNNITALGPFTSVMNDPNINLNSLKEHGNLLIKYQTNLNFYLSNMINAYFAALNKVSAASKEGNITSNEFRKIIINSFEDVFSTMFESPEFSMIYNNLANSIIDLIKSYQRFFDTNPLLFGRSQQILTKEEKDLLFYNLHEIKKLSLEIKKKLIEKKNE
jgi:hypothetical protein